MKIVWSPLALERVEEYGGHIAAANPAAAILWAEEVFAKVEPLADFPQLGRVVPEVGREEVRELFHGQYRIVYRVASAILILTVRHTRQLLSAVDIEEEA